jgi:hypothetical protein
MISMLWRTSARVMMLTVPKGAGAPFNPRRRKHIGSPTPRPGWPPTSSGAGHRARLRALEDDWEPFELLAEDW